ncbi:MAG TPA: M61 family peptidase [Rhodanobacteraceae bacterium]|nr:M61 family peptidase [Rhodanobacteraceae bacterium]
MKRSALASALAVALIATAWSGAGVAADITTPYSGTITLNVDMTQAPRRIFTVHETIPVKPGPLSLYYPKWIPGEHSPSGPITNVTGMVFTANGNKLPWRRDLVHMYEIHLDIPAGVTTLTVDFDFLSPIGGGSFGAGVSATPKIADLEWNQVVFYPAGYASKAITIQPNLKLPQGWKFATALQPHTGTGAGESSATRFQPVTLNNLVDSPIMSGEYFKQFSLSSGSGAPVYLDLVADTQGELDAKPKQIKQYSNLVTQANRMFGAHHYQTYHMLLTLSDHTDHFGLEHHQSSDDRIFADYFTNPKAYLVGSGLVPHEYTHSWNGKYRRPADLWTPDFNSVPMKDDLLWVYEGLTEYWSYVLTARSEFWTPAEFHQALAMTAAGMDHVAGRGWRPLQDTADMASLSYYVGGGWQNWKRGTDFYPEGVLLWLDVDTKIRGLSHDKHSLNDFAHLFYGMDSGSYVTNTYTFDDIVNALNKVQPYDWATFLRDILDARQYHAPLAGITQGGYKLVYTDKPSDMAKARQAAFGGFMGVDAMYTIGLSASGKGNIRDVLWDGPAFKAGLVPGMQIVAVDGKSFSSDALNSAIKNSKGSSAPIKLLVKNIEQYQTLEVDYHDGLKYPHLERVKGAKDYLDEIITPLKH